MTSRHSFDQAWCEVAVECHTNVQRDPAAQPLMVGLIGDVGDSPHPRWVMTWVGSELIRWDVVGVDTQPPQVDVVLGGTCLTDAMWWRTDGIGASLCRSVLGSFDGGELLPLLSGVGNHDVGEVGVFDLVMSDTVFGTWTIRCTGHPGSPILVARSSEPPVLRLVGNSSDLLPLVTGQIPLWASSSPIRIEGDFNVFPFVMDCAQRTWLSPPERAAIAAYLSFERALALTDAVGWRSRVAAAMAGHFGSGQAIW